MTKYKEVEVDLDDFSTDEIIDHLENIGDLTQNQTLKLKNIIDDSEEEYSELVLIENKLYQELIKHTSLDDQMKIEIILANLHKVSYNEVYNFFKQ